MKTFDLVFTDLCGRLDSMISFNDRDSALESFRLFDEPDSAELYSSISLFEYDCETRAYTEIRRMVFNRPPDDGLRHRPKRS